MSTKVKIIVVCLIVSVIGFLCFWIQKQNSEIAKLKASNNELIQQKELGDGTVRSSSTFASKKDIETLISDLDINLKELKKDISENNSTINGLQNLVIQSKGYIVKDVQSSVKTPGKNTDGTPVTVPVVTCDSGQSIECPDEYGYLTNRQQITILEKFDNTFIPLADVGFSSWKEKPWDYRVYSRNYNVTTVVALDENGRNTFYNKVTIDSDNKKYTIHINNSEFIQIEPKSKFRFNPRLYFGIDAGLVVGTKYGLFPESLGEIIPGLQVSIFTYGKTKLDTEWSFLHIGLGYGVLNKTIAATISPVNYNIGKPIPLIENLFLGPTISIDTNGHIGILLGLKVGL